jgi:hypothetical protein
MGTTKLLVVCNNVECWNFLQVIMIKIGGMSFFKFEDSIGVGETLLL